MVTSHVYAGLAAVAPRASTIDALLDETKREREEDGEREAGYLYLSVKDSFTYMAAHLRGCLVATHARATRIFFPAFFLAIN